MTATLLAAWLLAVGLTAHGLRVAAERRRPRLPVRLWVLAVLAAGPVGLVWFTRARGARRRAVRPYVGGCLGLLAGTLAWWALPLGFAGAAVAYFATLAGGFLAVFAREHTLHRTVGFLTRHGGPGLASMAGATVTLSVLFGRPGPTAPLAWVTVLGGFVAGAVVVPATTRIAGRLPLASPEVAP